MHALISLTFGCPASSVDDWIEQNLDSGKVVSRNQVSSSSWSSAYVYETESGTKYFVKQSGRGADEGMFKGEALGLQAMYGKCFTRKLAVVIAYLLRIQDCNEGVIVYRH